MSIPSPNRSLAARAEPWLLLLPSIVLFATFTHIPIVRTAIDSFHSTPKGARPSRFVGLANYEDMAADPIFWKALINNLVYAIGTIPLSIGLALAMALFVNGRIAGRGRNGRRKRGENDGGGAGATNHPHKTLHARSDWRGGKIYSLDRIALRTSG